LEQPKDEIKAAGLRAVAIGLGEPKHARRYCGQLAPSLTCYCNQAGDIYRAYGLGRGSAGQLVNPGLWTATLRATLRGHVQGKATGDVKMLPGTFIINRQGVVQYVYYSQHAGDQPDFGELLRAV